MGIDAAVTAAILVVVVVVLVRELASPAATLLGAVVALTLTGVLGPGQAFAGFSNEATVTVAGLFVVAAAIQQHTGVDRAVASLLERGRSESGALALMVAPVALASSVIANTPLVAALAPTVRGWAERSGRPASHFLMPLSFAAILGGLITTIGTSTTLVVSGLVAQAGMEPFDLTTMTPVGLPVALAGGALLVLLAPRLLPDRRSPHEQVTSRARDYTARLEVTPGGALDDSSVEAGGLRNLEDVFLARVDRGRREISPVRPDESLRGGDVLTFVGGVEHIRDLLDRPGLNAPAESQAHLLDGDGHGLVEVVLSATSPLVGRSLKEASFRGRYSAAVVAVHRAGVRVEGKLGEVRLQAGDALLLMTDDGFAGRWRDRHDFAVVVSFDGGGRAHTSRRPLVLATVGAMVAAAATGVTGLLVAVLGACAVLVGTRTVSFHRARESLDLDVLIIIGSAIGVGSAVRVSGLAGMIADGIAEVAVVTGQLGALAAVLVGTLVLTEIVTNVAAAALMVPVALSVAGRLDADPTTFAVAVAIAASASFLTPIGYQTNTIVYGLGGYRFGDYWRLGLPLTAVVVITSLIVLSV